MTLLIDFIYYQFLILNKMWTKLNDDFFKEHKGLPKIVWREETRKWTKYNSLMLTIQKNLYFTCDHQDNVCILCLVLSLYVLLGQNIHFSIHLLRVWFVRDFGYCKQIDWN